MAEVAEQSVDTELDATAVDVDTSDGAEVSNDDSVASSKESVGGDEFVYEHPVLGKFTAKDLEKGIMLHRDYTKKTQELSKTREQTETEWQAKQEELKQQQAAVEKFNQLPEHIRNAILEDKPISSVEGANVPNNYGDLLESIKNDQDVYKPLSVFGREITSQGMLLKTATDKIRSIEEQNVALSNIIWNMGVNQQMKDVAAEFQSKNIPFDRDAIQKAILDGDYKYSDSIVKDVAKSLYEAEILKAAREEGMAAASKEQDALKRSSVAGGKGTPGKEATTLSWEEQIIADAQAIDKKYGFA